MLSRWAGRLVTSPAAFLVAGVIDLLVYGLSALARRASSTMARR